MSREIPRDFFSPEFDDAVETFKDRFLHRDWDEYLALVRKVEDHPCNRSGSDKTWVERLLEVNRQHYRRAIRVR